MAITHVLFCSHRIKKSRDLQCISETFLFMFPSQMNEQGSWYCLVLPQSRSAISQESGIVIGIVTSNDFDQATHQLRDSTDYL